MVRIVHPELSYKIMGILFEVHSKLGNKYQEKYYQNAIELAFKKNDILYKRELPIDIMYDGERIGKYFLDFLVEGQVVLEVKTIPEFLSKDFTQLLAYLKTKNLELGILANFRTDRLSYRRVLNPDFKLENSDHS